MQRVSSKETAEIGTRHSLISKKNMPLIYAFVARRQTVLAEFTNYSGNFSTIATQVRATRRERGLEGLNAA